MKTKPFLAALSAFFGVSSICGVPAVAQSVLPVDDELIVVSSRVPMPLRRVATAASSISGSEVELRGYSSLADVLRTQAGVAVSNSGGLGQTTALRIRGEEGFRTLTVIDGVEVSDPAAPQVTPLYDHLLATGDVERVEVLRGPQGYMYGADAGGVVNIVTRRGADALSGNLGLEGGAFGTRRYNANVSGGGELGDFYIAVNDISTDGFNARADDTVLADNDGYENTTVHARLGLNTGNLGRLEFVVRDIDARALFDGCSFPTVHDCSGEAQQSTARLGFDYDHGELMHRFSYAQSETLRSNFTNGVSSFVTRGEITHAEYTGTWSTSPAHNFVYGIDLENEAIRGSDGAFLEREQDAYYVEYQGRFSDRLFVTVGARHDDNEDFGGHTSARASIAYVRATNDGASLKYRGSFGTGFRAPSLFEVSYNRGPFAFAPAAEADLFEETSQGLDLGIEFTASGGSRYSLTYFDQDIEDEIYFDLVGFSGYVQETGQTNSVGFELEADVRLNDYLRFVSNLTFNDTKNADGLQRIRRPDQYGNIGLHFRSINNRLQIIGNYRLSENSIDEVFGLGRVKLNDYAVLDVSAAYTVNDRIALHARIENLGDEIYEEVRGFNTAGRTASFGVRLSLH